MIEAARVERLLAALALAVLAYVIASSVARPLFYWDNWAYHLPFSALLWDIGDARRAFILSEYLRMRYEGFPLFAELVQGALWKLTGTINATTLVNSLALAGFVVAVGKTLRACVPVLAFGALSVPMLALHAISSYIDLFVAVCVCFQVLAAVKLASTSGNGERPRRAAACAWVAVYVAAAAAAGNTKITGLMLTHAISGFVLAHLLMRRRVVGREQLRLVVLAVVLGGVLAAGTSVRNTYKFSNPVYPFDVRVAGLHLKGLEGEYRNYPDYTEALGVLSGPANWLLSITEIDWAVRGVDSQYTLDSAVGDKPLRHGPARTGGYWGALMIATLLLCAGLAVLAARRNRQALADNAFVLALFAYVTVVTGFLPQSHELRYYLHWPLMLMLVAAVLVNAAGLSAKARAGIATAYLGAFIASQYMLDFPWRVWPLRSQHFYVSEQASEAEIAHARRTGAVCLGPDYNPRQFAYASIFHGGEYVIEQGWLHCERYPQYVGPSAAR